MKIPLFVKAKASPTMLTVNVRNIMPMSENVPVTTIILNVMLRLGVNKTDITRQPVLFRTMLTSPAPVTALSIKVVKEIMTGPVKKPVLPSPVRQVRSSKRTPAAALMTHLTAPVVNRQDVRLIRL